TSAVRRGMIYLGHAYVAPPASHLVITDGRLDLVDGPPVHFVKPSADVLFESAALAFGPRLMSVVLSGSGVDGAAGTRAVHDHGGITLTQEPESVDFRGMPEAAIATGSVDYVGNLQRLGSIIERLVLEGKNASVS